MWITLQEITFVPGTLQEELFLSRIKNVLEFTFYSNNPFTSWMDDSPLKKSPV